MVADVLMASIDKQSVRSKFDEIKSNFQEQVDSGKVNPEVSAMFNALIMLFEIVLSIFLERKTKKNSKNSSIPPSQTNKDESALGSQGSNSKGKNENNAIANNTRVNETITLIQVNTCNICGEDLSQAPAHECERRTKIDIIFEKTMAHFDAEIKQCTACKSTVKGQFPSDMPGPLQYGNGLKAYIINLAVCQMVALGRIQKLVKSMIGVVISEASILKFILRLHQALADWEASSIEKILKHQSIYVDETSLRVNKKNYWIHVHCAEDITLKFLHRKRGIEAIEYINIIPRYGGAIVHDCWASYLSYKHCEHGLCGSHLLRELTFVVESNSYAWARNMKRLLQETCRAVSKSKVKKLSEKDYANLQKRYRNILTRGEKELPSIPPNPKGRRGKIAKSDAHNLWERLKKHETAVLLFAKNSHVSFTNNRAERDLRMAKVKQKVSGCFRTEIYAQAYCRISSYLQTMANKGINPLIAIQMALAGEIES